MNLMTIYNHSPILIQNILTTVQGYRLKRVRYSKFYKTALDEYLKRNYSDLDALKEYQRERTAELLRFAVKNSPFYREFYSGIDVERAIREGDLSLLPILDKETVRSNSERIYAIAPKEGLFSDTSGTTGTSIRILHTKEDTQRRMAYLDAFKHRAGFIHMKMKRASFSSAKVVPRSQSKKVFWRDNLSIKQRIYSGYHCQGDNLPYYVQNLDKYKPESMDGYPSAMYELAKYIISHNIQLSFTPIAIFPTAETLLPHYREAIEEAFKCPVYDQYASSEGAPFIVQCKNGKLHYCMDTGIIEFENDGRMIVTCFETHGTPLIRYDIGDSAYLAEDQSCDCGCRMPIVSRIEGRGGDYILSPTKGKFTAIYLSLVSAEFKGCMKAMQFIQNEVGAVDVYLETDEKYNPEMNKIIVDKLHYSMGDEMNIRIHVVDSIPKEPSGKFRFIINNIG